MLVESNTNSEGKTISTIISTPNLDLIRDLLDTEATIEKGISIVLVHRDITQEELVVPNSNYQVNQHQLPYLYKGRAFYPVSERGEMVKLYKYMKKFSAISDNLDIRERKELIDKIKFLSDNLFYEQKMGKEEAVFKKRFYVLYNITCIINLMAGKPLIAALWHLCSLVAIDFKTLARIIMSSTISEEKKQFILKKKKKNYVDLDLTKEDWYVWPYVRLDKDFNDYVKIAGK